MEEKSFKDPIYGYIYIRAKLVNQIIDTAIFQRLRNIRQTSYEPLYSSALHNRFIHSIGVYYLGKIAAKSIRKFLSKRDDIKDIDIENIIDVFLLACLLHDVGHSPFSHSGEQFYTVSENIREKLEECVNDEKFTKDSKEYEKSQKTAKPHEIMSAIVGILNYQEIIQPKNKALFARCITGYQYPGETIEEKICNCFISLLNSGVIDVDKLDYLIRDSYVIGYDSVKIDYERLLSNVMITQEFQLAFHKNALSVIENVVYARDAEKKWIQNHPIVQYETFLVQHAIKKINEIYEKDGEYIFCYESLTEKGKILKNNKKVSLLCDDDVIAISKNELDDKLVQEIFSRIDRKHPIWKSEAEYQTLFKRKLGEETMEKFEKDMKAIQKELEGMKLPIINRESLEALKRKIEEYKQDKKLDELTRNQNIEAMLSNLKWFETLEKYSKDNNLDFEYVLINTKTFHSGFEESNLGDILIYFPQINKTNKLKEITSLLTTYNKGENYFYMYYKRKRCTKDYNCEKCQDNCKINVESFAQCIKEQTIK